MNSNESTPIARTIKQRRKEKGWTQKALADKTGISDVVLSRLETSTNRKPNISTLSKLAPYLGRPLDELLLISSYEGTLPDTDSIFLDLEGKRINLQDMSQDMYRKDAELFFAISTFYEHYSNENGDFLKILLNAINKEFSLSSSEKRETPRNKIESNFLSIFTSLKAMVFSLSGILN